MMEEAIDDQPISYSTGILHQEEGADCIPSDIELAGMYVRLTNVVDREAVLRNVLEPLKKRYDYCLIDCMPSLGMLTIGALAASDSVLIPVQAQHFPLKGLIALVKNIQMVRRRINPKLSINGIVMTMVDNRTNLPKDVCAIATILGYLCCDVFFLAVVLTKSKVLSVCPGDCRAGRDQNCHATVPLMVCVSAY